MKRKAKKRQKAGPKKRPASAGAVPKQEDPARGPAAQAAGEFLQRAYDAPDKPQTHGDLTATARMNQIGGSKALTVSVEGLGWSSSYKRAGGIPGIDGGQVSWLGPRDTPLTADANLKSATGKLVTAFMDESEDTDTDSTDDQGQDVDQDFPPMLTPEEEVIEGEALSIAEQLKNWFKEGWSSWLGFAEKNQGSDMFPGYVPVKRVSPRPFREGWRTAGGEELSDEDLTEQTENTEQAIATPEQKKEALGWAQKLMETIRKLHGSEEQRNSITEKELNDLAANMVITRQGVMFGPPDKTPLYLQWRTKSDGTVDIYRNGADQINELINERNRDKAEDERKINLIETPKVMGQLTSKRGNMLEQMTVFNDWAMQYKELDCGEDPKWLKKGDPEYDKWMAKCGRIESRIGEALKEAQKWGTDEEIRQMFNVGGRVVAGEILVPFDASQDGDMVTNIIKSLKEEYGLSESHAAAVVHAAVASSDPQVAMLILVSSTLGYNKWTEGLDIEDSWVSGGKGQLKGEKADITRIITQDSFNELKERMEDPKRISDTEKELAEAAGCAGTDTGVGMDTLGEVATKYHNGKDLPKGEEFVEFGTEQKALSSSDGRTKLGEGKNNKFRQMCTPVLDEDEKPMVDPDTGKVIDGRPRNTEKQKADIKTEDEFMDLNDKRIANCLGHATSTQFKQSLGTNDDGEPKTLREVACDFQEEINESMREYDAAFAGRADFEGQDVATMGHQYVNFWLDPAGGSAGVCAPGNSNNPGEKKCSRAKLAREAVTAISKGEEGDLTPPQREALSKVRDEIEQRKIQERFQKGDVKKKRDELNAQVEKGEITEEEAKKQLAAQTPTAAEKATGEAFLLYRMSIEGGALDEGFKDVRSYGADRYQKVGLINQTVYGAIGMFLKGEASISSQGNTHHLSMGDQNLLSVSMERGQAVIELHDDIMGDVPEGSPFQDAGPKDEEDQGDSGKLFRHYLEGQQKLLEVLLSQTT